MRGTKGQVQTGATVHVGVCRSLIGANSFSLLPTCVDAVLVLSCFSAYPEKQLGFEEVVNASNSTKGIGRYALRVYRGGVVFLPQRCLLSIM